MTTDLSNYLKFWGVAKNPRAGDKRPYGMLPNGSVVALSTTSRRGWMSYERARDLADRLGPDAAVGVCLHRGCGIVAVDLDKDYAADQMEMVEWLDSYAETSSSGLGTHVFVRADLAGGVRDSRIDIEVYGQERFVIVTGNVINGWDTVEPRQGKIDRLVRRLGGIKASTKPAATAPALVPEEAQRAALRKVWKSINVKRLWSGEWQDNYPSQSEADAALIEALCWATDDDACVAAVFRRSGLGRRSKAQTNYVERTIANIRRYRAMRAIDDSAIVADVLAGAYNADPVVNDADKAVQTSQEALINRLMDQIDALTKQVADLTAKLADATAHQNAPAHVAETVAPIEQHRQDTLPSQGDGVIDWSMVNDPREPVRQDVMDAPYTVDADGVIIDAEPSAAPEPTDTVAAIDLSQAQEAGLPPGIAGQVVADICKSVRGSTPVDFASGSIIAAVSGFAARSVESFSGPQYGITNHVVLCAPPGAGKNVAAVVTGIMSEMAPHAALSASTVGGRASVTKLRAQIPAGLIHWSEIGTDLARLSQDQSGSVGIRQVIQMFDRSPMSAPEASLTVGGSVIPRHYYMAMVADTQPAYMDHLLSADASGSGLLSRLTVINYQPAMRAIDGEGRQISEASMSALRRVAAMPERGAGSDNPTYERVRATPEARRLLEWHDRQRRMQVGGYRRHDRRALADACARLHARAERAATAVAILNDPSTPVITEDVAAWAIKLINYHWLLMIDAVRDSDKSASTIAIETLHRCIHDATTRQDSPYRDPDGVLDGDGVVTGRTIQRIIAANPRLTRTLAKNGMDDRSAISRMMNIMVRDYGVLQKLTLGKERSVVAYRLMQAYRPGMYDQ